MLKVSPSWASPRHQNMMLPFHSYSDFYTFLSSFPICCDLTFCANCTPRSQTDDAGSSWFGLPRTKLTPELKRDFQVLRLRGALDPKVHYKKSAAKSLVPRYSHVGEVVEGPTEFNSARLTKRERKTTFADEVLSAQGLKERSKFKYSGIQKQKTNGKKAYYKARRRQSRA